MTWDDPTLWLGAYVAAGVALVLNDLVTEDAETLRVASRLPRVAVVVVGLAVVSAFIALWPAILTARGVGYLTDRKSDDDDDDEESE